jgi:hypothetical protein
VHKSFMPSKILGMKYIITSTIVRLLGLS